MPERKRMRCTGFLPVSGLNTDEIPYQEKVGPVLLCWLRLKERKTEPCCDEILYFSTYHKCLSTAVWCVLDLNVQECTLSVGGEKCVGGRGEWTHGRELCR